MTIGRGSTPPPPTSFYAEIWSDHANLIACCTSQEQLDYIVKGLLEYGWTQSNGHDKSPEPWFVIDYSVDIEE